MTSNTTLMRVFLASPGDLDVERDVVAAAIEELNLGLAPTQNVRLELVRWEDHGSPALGSDPQAIINSQLGDDFEVFIGLLWTRFGSPTPRAESGTMEEFERAKARWIRDPQSVSVMFYFKEEPIPPAEVDTEQLAKVQKFRRDLGSTAIYGTFVGAEDLGRLVRIHLTRHLVGRGSSGVTNPEQQIATARTGATDDQEDQEVGDQDEEGLLDLVERANEKFQNVIDVLARMTATMQDLNDSTQKASSEIANAKKDDGQVDNKIAKRAINDFADKMEAIAGRFEADSPLFREAFSSAIDAFMGATEISMDFGQGITTAVKGNREAITGLVTQSETSLGMIDGLRNSTDNLPRLTTQFNRARKRLSAVLAEVHREFSSANTLAREAVGVVDETLMKLETRGQ